MKFGLFTDPHLGLVRAAHTTVESRKRLRDALYTHTMDCIRSLRDEGAEQVFCFGDLFDTYTNDESVLLQGHAVVRAINGCMAGNHDIANRMDKIGSLQALHKILSDTEDQGKLWINSEPNRPGAKFARCGSSGWAIIPHVLTQELFCESLDMAISRSRNCEAWEGKSRILCLHCNVGVPGHGEATDDGTTLYLTDEWQEKVLEEFDFVFVGHEHPPRSLHGGRIRLLGNIMPIAFGEIADRYVYIFDDEEKTLREIKVYDTSTEYKEIDVETLLGAEGDLPVVNASAVQIIGRVRRSDQAALARAIAKFWRTNDDYLYMVRNATVSEEVAQAERNEATFVPKSLPEIVGESIQSTPYREAYDEAVRRVDEPSSGC